MGDATGRVCADDVADRCRSRGSRPGTGCPAPRPRTPRAPGPRCRGTRSSRAPPPTSRRSRRRARGACRDRHDRDVRVDRGERVVAGLGSAWVSALNRVDLPALGSPTIPTFTQRPREEAGRPRRRLHAHASGRPRSPASAPRGPLTDPGHEGADHRPQGHSRQDIRRVVHPQVGAGYADAGRERVEGKASPGLDPPERRRGREGRGRMG